MVYQIPPIAASLINNTSIEAPSGRGVVEEQIDESTFVIRLPSGSVTVRVPQGSLSLGDPVYVSFRGDTVLIERLVPQGGKVEDLSYLLELNLGPKIDELVTLLKDLRSLLSPGDIEPGLLRQLDAAIQFFAKSDTDIYTLLQVIHTLNEEILSRISTVGQSYKQEIFEQIAKLLSSIADTMTDFPAAGKEIFPASQSPVLTLPKTAEPDPAFVYVNNKSEAIDLLLQHLDAVDPGTEKYLSTIKDEPLFIRFYESANGEKKAIIMPRQQAIVEIQHFLRSEMQSAVMKQLDPLFIADTIIQRGAIAISQFLEIDKLLAFVSPEGAAPLIKEDALTITLPQLVSVALEAGSNTAVDFKAALTRIGSSIPALVQKIIDVLEKSGYEFKLPEIVNTILKNMSLENINKREEFISLMFKRMGYSFENEMSVFPLASAAGLQENSPSLKLALLMLLGYLNKVVEEKSLMEKASPDVKSPGKNMVITEAQTETLKMTKSLIRQADQAGREIAQPVRITAEMIRQQVETVLNHIESLQVLAKSVPTAEGQQQVLVLPLNIGNEWVEMRVKFVKERHDRGGGKKPGHISVMLNVDLSLLGEVTASMDYEIKKSLSISFTFENIQAKRWFQKNKKEFVDAITGLGFNAVQLKLLHKSGAKEINGFLPQEGAGVQRANFDVTG